MRTINLKESLIRIDQETGFKYTLTDLYEACQLDEKKKRNLANLIKEYDHAGMNAKLSNASQMSSMLTDASGIMTENVSDDIPDDEMPENIKAEGWSPDLTDCPACGDISFDSKRGRCTACSYRESLHESNDFIGCDATLLSTIKSYLTTPEFKDISRYVNSDCTIIGCDSNGRLELEFSDGKVLSDIPKEYVKVSIDESLNESFAEGDMVWVKPSNKPGRVVSVRGEQIEVEVMGGTDPDRRDVFYPEDLEMEISSNEPDEELDFSCYNLTDEQIEKVKYIRQHLNTPEGYRAYYELEKEITDEGGCMDIFYDLSADFAWDNRFSVAITKLALADNRPDLADPNYLPGGCYYQYMEDPKYANVLLEDASKPDLESTLRAAAEPKLREMDYDDDFINEYFGIKLEDTEDNRIKVTVWGELYYEELDELANVLNHIVAEEDPEAYFDHETSGRIVAYIRKDQSEDIPDEAIVSEWSEKFNSCTTWEQLKDVYGEFYNIRDDLNNGTHRALYDIIDKKIDELKPVKESLTEDAEVPAAIYSMLNAADKYVDNDEYPEGASEEEIIEIAKNNPDCMKVTKWVDGQTGPDEVVWERPVDTWFICQYEGGAEYEHAEGGYYYETLTFLDKETFPSKEAAQKRLAELADEAREEGEDVIAQTDDFFRIKTGKYIGDCEEYHVEAKEGAHASGKKVYEGLNEAILNEINSPEEKPYSAEEIKKEIKSLTQNFTREKDNLKCGFKEENDAAVKELKKHYAKVTSEKRGEWFEITFSGLKKDLKEALNNYKVTFYMDSLDDNVMSGPSTTKMIRASSEEEAKKKLIDSSTDKYYIPTVTKVELVEGTKLSEGTKQKRIACTTEFDNGNVIHNDWQEISDEEAEELAKQRSIENPDKVYYVKYDDIMNPCSDYKWKNGQRINEAAETSKEWEHKGKDGKIGRIRQSDGNGDGKPLTRDQAKEIAEFRGHGDDELYPVNESVPKKSTSKYRHKYVFDRYYYYYKPSFTEEEYEAAKKSGNFPEEMWKEGVAYIRYSRIEGMWKVTPDCLTNNSANYYELCDSFDECVEYVKEYYLAQVWIDTPIPPKSKRSEVKPSSSDYLQAIKQWVGEDRAAEIVYNWYNNEDAFHNFNTVEEFIAYAKKDIYDLLDSADVKERKIVAKAIGYDLYDEELDESKSMIADEMTAKHGTSNADGGWNYVLSNDNYDSVKFFGGYYIAKRTGFDRYDIFEKTEDGVFVLKDGSGLPYSVCQAIIDDINNDSIKKFVNASKPEEERVALKEGAAFGITEMNSFIDSVERLGFSKTRDGYPIVYKAQCTSELLKDTLSLLKSNHFKKCHSETYDGQNYRETQLELSHIDTRTDILVRIVRYYDGENIITLDLFFKNLTQNESLTEAMTYTDTNGFLGDPGETYTMSQFRRMWQDRDNDPVMSGYDSFEEWVGETISQMDAHEDDNIGVAPSGRGKLSCAIFTDKSGIMGKSGAKYTVNDLADYWEANRGSDPVLAGYKGDWKAWLDDTIAQMEIEYDSCLFEESLSPEEFEIQNYKDVINDLKNLKLNPANFNKSIQFRYPHVIVTFKRLSEETIDVSVYRPGGMHSWTQSSSLERLIEWAIKSIKQHGPYEIRHIEEGLESKTFTDKEEAKKFAKDNKGAITSVVDDKLNPTHYVHYKGKKEPIKESKNELDKLNTILAAQGDELRRLKKDGAAKSEIDKIIKDLEDTKKKIAALCEAVEGHKTFADMLNDPETQRANAEYHQKMQAKFKAEDELAKEAKSWPDDKELTYEEALALAKAYYAQGGDGFYETIEKYQFDDEVSMFGPMTVGQMKRDFGVYDSVAKDRMGDDLL